MHRRTTATFVSALLCAGLVWPMAGSAQTPDGRTPTKFQYLPDALDALLNSGFEVRGDMGMGSQIVLAKREGATTRWIICGLNVTNGQLQSATQQKTTTSTCFALN